MTRPINRISSYVFLFVIGILLSSACQSGSSAIADQISADINARDAHQMILENSANENFVIIDTRTPAEFEKGYLENAVCIDFRDLSFKQQIDKLDRNKKYLIYCRSGNRSKTTLNMMKKMDFIEAYNMDGGIKAWTKEGFESVK